MQEGGSDPGQEEPWKRRRLDGGRGSRLEQRFFHDFGRGGGGLASNSSQTQSERRFPSTIDYFPVDTSAPCGSGRACPRHMC